MRSAYKYLASAIPVLVTVQAMAIAVAAFGLFSYMDKHSIAKGAGDEASFTGDFGFIIHGLNGQFLIPLVAIVLLIVSFFAKIPGGTKWALFIVGDVVLQIAFAFIAFGAPLVGLLHGLNAFVLAGLGIMAARAASVTPAAPVTETSSTATV